MVYLGNLLPQRRHVPVRHSLHNDKGKGTLAKVLQENVLSLHRLHVPGQIVQHVIVDAGGSHPQNRGNQEQQGKHQDQHPMLHHCVSKLSHRIILSGSRFAPIA